MINKRGKIRSIVIILMISMLFFIAGFVWCNLILENAPDFSVESGFYVEEFYLEMSSEPGSKIYYTLDGTRPTVQSLIYDGPILIQDATRNENVYSMITDTSTGFYRDKLEEYGIMHKDPGYKAPDYLIDKCTVIRAVAVSASGERSEEASATYFVGIEPKKYDGCKIISLISEPRNLFDSEYGIYVTGDVYEEYMEGDEIDDSWRWWLANYRMKGSEWEREAIFHFFNEDGKEELKQKGGIKIHGGVSRAMLPKGLNFYARNTYDGQENFDFMPFDNFYKPKRMTLASGGNQVITQFSDYMMSERLEGVVDFVALRHEPYVLFINGEYWGFYWLNEKYDEKYLSYYYDVKEDNVILIKNDELKVGDEGQQKLYYEVEKFIVEHDMTDNENYRQACEMIDIDNYIDYNAVLTYIARQEDWPFSNWAVWRTKEAELGKYGDYRIRWLLFDCNSSAMGNVEGLVEHNTLNYLINTSPMFGSLWENEDFRNKFEKRILYIADECFEKEEMNDFIDKYCEEMVPILSMSWDRFYGSDNEKIEEFHKIMGWQRQFFEARKEVVESWFAE